MRALITGAAGFVGQHLIRHLSESGDEIVACFFPHPPDPKVAAARSNVRWVPLDIRDQTACAKVFSDARPEVVYHLAGMSFVPEAEQNFMGALESNVAGFEYIARTCHQLQSGIRLVLAGSADVYGKVSPQDLPVHELTPVRPINAYSITKLMSELVADRWTRLGKVEIIVMRPFNHIGPGQDVRFVAPSFAQQLALIALKRQPPRLQVGNLAARKDFTDVRDVVRAYRLAAQKGRGHYVICAGHSVPVQSILDTLIKISGLHVEVTQDPARMRPAEVPELYGSYAKAEKELGWKPLINLDQSLRDIYEEILARVQSS